MFPYYLLSFVRMTSLDALRIIYTLYIHHLCIIFISCIVIYVVFLYIIYYYLCNVSISFIVIFENDVTGCLIYIYYVYTPLVHHFYMIYYSLCVLFMLIIVICENVVTGCAACYIRFRWKETYEQDLFIWKETYEQDLSIWKEAPVYMKRNPCVYEKRPIHM